MSPLVVSRRDFQRVHALRQGETYTMVAHRHSAGTTLEVVHGRGGPIKVAMVYRKRHGSSWQVCLRKI